MGTGSTWTGKQSHSAKEQNVQKRIVAGVVAGALLIGGAGVALTLPGQAAAADPTASPSAAATAAPVATTAPTATSGTTGTPCAPGDHAGGPGGKGGDRGPGGLDADDLTAAAKALGMTEAALTTELQAGKTTAAVATAKGVALQKVIDAIVASDKAEIAAAVKAGTMTQAQADQRLANLAAHVTDEVNGVAGGPGGMGGHGGPGAPDAAAPTAAPSSGTSG